MFITVEIGKANPQVDMREAMECLEVGHSIGMGVEEGPRRARAQG
jgi:hypothetical protein